MPVKPTLLTRQKGLSVGSQALWLEADTLSWLALPAYMASCSSPCERERPEPRASLKVLMLNLRQCRGPWFLLNRDMKYVIPLICQKATRETGGWEGEP